jgi:hypothetical protein
MPRVVAVTNCGRLMEIVSGRSMKQEALDAATRIENPRP